MCFFDLIFPLFFWIKRIFCYFWSPMICGFAFFCTFLFSSMCFVCVHGWNVMSNGFSPINFQCLSLFCSYLVRFSLRGAWSLCAATFDPPVLASYSHHHISNSGFQIGTESVSFKNTLSLRFVHHDRYHEIKEIMIDLLILSKNLVDPKLWIMIAS